MRLAWNIWAGPKCHRKCPDKREEEGDTPRHTRGEANVLTEAEIGVMGS